jgi:hypothetical protein
MSSFSRGEQYGATSLGSSKANTILWRNFYFGFPSAWTVDCTHPSRANPAAFENNPQFSLLRGENLGKPLERKVLHIAR